MRGTKRVPLLDNEVPASFSERRSREKLRRMVLHLLRDDPEVVATVMDAMSDALIRYPMEAGFIEQMRCAAWELRNRMEAEPSED